MNEIDVNSIDVCKERQLANQIIEQIIEKYCVVRNKYYYKLEDEITLKLIAAKKEG